MYYFVKFHLRYLLLLGITVTQASCIKTAVPCNGEIELKKVRGLKTLVLERPRDQIDFVYSDKKYTFILNKNYELILDNGKTQTKITSLLHQGTKPAFFIQIDWYGDNNKDCKLDFILWKKLGIYLGNYQSTPGTHIEAFDEKFSITSDSSLSYTVESLGQY
jgi:hypothetical protein